MLFPEGTKILLDAGLCGLQYQRNGKTVNVDVVPIESEVVAVVVETDPLKHLRHKDDTTVVRVELDGVVQEVIFPNDGLRGRASEVQEKPGIYSRLARWFSSLR
jgi:hypothetical protein